MNLWIDTQVDRSFDGSIRFHSFARFRAFFMHTTTIKDVKSVIQQIMKKQIDAIYTITTFLTELLDELLIAHGWVGGSLFQFSMSLGDWFFSHLNGLIFFL